MKYRTDIDGLRALAVVPVVLFHADFSLFSGGFVGVDIFFVISGFLITKIIADEIVQGRFSIANFYERRVRRIFPALFTMFAFTMLAGMILLLPEDLSNLGTSLTAATFFVSNIFFWKQSGYFDSEAEMKPLLHMWSLAIEEQFYVFFPIFLIIAWRYGRHWKILTWVGLIGSLLLSIYVVRYYNSSAFYLLPTRAWELLAGSVIALGAVPALHNQKLREGLAALGLALIFFCIFFYDRTTLFPGERALLPCLGACLILYTGLNGQTSFAGRLLSLKPVVFIGLISYSLYLWHWPLIVYAKYYNIAPLTHLQSSGIVFLSVVMGVLSWRYIERPFRKPDSVFKRAGMLQSGLAMMIVMSGLGYSAHASQGWPSRLPSGTLQLLQAASDPPLCEQDVSEIYQVKNICLLGNDPDAKPDTLIWGDSHARALRPGFDRAAKMSGHPALLAELGGCIPMIAAESSNSLKPCAAHNKKVLEMIRKHNIRHVIFAARWSVYTMDMPVPLHPEKFTQVYLSDMQSEGKSMDESKAVFKRSLERTLQALEDQKIEISVLAQVPTAPIPVPRTLARAQQFGSLETFNAEGTRAKHDALQAFALDIFKAEAAKGRITLVDMIDEFCDRETCRIMDAGIPLYADENHLSVYESLKLAPQLAKIIEE